MELALPCCYCQGYCHTGLAAHTHTPSTLTSPPLSAGAAAMAFELWTPTTVSLAAAAAAAELAAEQTAEQPQLESPEAPPAPEATPVLAITPAPPALAASVVDTRCKRKKLSLILST